MKVSLRRAVTRPEAIALQLASVAVFILLWTVLTSGEPEERVLSPLTIN